MRSRSVPATALPSVPALFLSDASPHPRAPLARAVHTQSGRPIICRFYFLDGNVKAIGINSYTTAQQAIKDLAKRIDLPDPTGWSIYEVFPDRGPCLARAERPPRIIHSQAC